MSPKFQQIYSTFILVAAALIFFQQRRDAAELDQIAADLSEFTRTVAPSFPQAARTIKSEPDNQASVDPPKSAFPTTNEAEKPPTADLMLRVTIEHTLRQMQEALNLPDGQLAEVRDVTESYMRNFTSGDQSDDATKKYKADLERIIGAENVERFKQSQMAKLDAMLEARRKNNLPYYEEKLKLDPSQSEAFESVMKEADKVIFDIGEEMQDRQFEMLKDPSKAQSLRKEIQERRRSILTEKSRAILNDDQYNSFLELLNNSQADHFLFM